MGLLGVCAIGIAKLIYSEFKNPLNSTKEEGNEYIFQYPMVDQTDMVPRDQIRLVPESKLSKFRKAELSQLRKGTKYKLVTLDTPENRESITQRAIYYQMVAYKEGWEFDPNNYQVKFVNPNFFSPSEKGKHKRIYQLKEEMDPKDLPIEFEKLSPERRVGFTVHKRVADRMDNKEADGLASRVINLFGG